MQPNWPSEVGQAVVVVGGANLDVLGRATGALAPCDSAPGRVAVSRGGVSRNVAENLARLGHRVRLISALGQDDAGRRLLSETAAAGVDVSSVHRFAELPTATYLSLHGADGVLAMAVNDMRVMDLLTPEILLHYQPLLTDASTLVLDCNLSERSLGWLITHAPNASVFVDAVSAAKCTRLSPWLPHIHTLKLNRMEAGVLTGAVVTTRQDAEAAAEKLRRAGVRNVVVSLGAEGVCWQGQDAAPGYLTARAVKIVNTNGAGDALLAGIVSGHLAALPLAQAVQRGLACAEQTLLSEDANLPNQMTDRIPE